MPTRKDKAHMKRVIKNIRQKKARDPEEDEPKVGKASYDRARTDRHFERMTDYQKVGPTDVILTRKEFNRLIKAAVIGAEWEIGNSIGVPDDPSAVAHCQSWKRFKAQFIKLRNEKRKRK